MSVIILLFVLFCQREASGTGEGARWVLFPDITTEKRKLHMLMLGGLRGGDRVRISY